MPMKRFLMFLMKKTIRRITCGCTHPEIKAQNESFSMITRSPGQQDTQKTFLKVIVAIFKLTDMPHMVVLMKSGIWPAWRMPEENSRKLLMQLLTVRLLEVPNHLKH